MSAPSSHAADRRDGELENTALRPGYEQPRTAAHLFEINPKHGAATGRRKLVGYQLLRMRAGDSDLRLSLSGPTRQFLPANNRAASSLGSVVRSKLLPAAAIAGRLSALGAPFRLFRFFGRIFRAVRTRLPSLSFSIALQAAKQAARCCSKAFHFHSLSAQVTGLDAGVYGQHTDRRKKKCPTKALKDSTK